MSIEIIIFYIVVLVSLPILVFTVFVIRETVKNNTESKRIERELMNKLALKVNKNIRLMEKDNFIVPPHQSLQ